MANDQGTSGLPRDIISSFRTGNTKSRNGCVVCKIRRVKCDETKPHCTRCTSTGRKCDGYGKAPKRNKSKSPTPKPPPRTELVPIAPSSLVYAPSTDVQASPEERRGFRYFRSRNMSDMPGSFEPYFWDHIVLQFSKRYPTILQALVALSAIYEGHDRRRGWEPIRIRSEDYALQQYTKAVKDLMHYLASENQDPRVALMSCLIFIWIEFMQNNLTSGFQHLNAGLNILRDLKCSAESRIREKDSEDILGSLDRLFTRLRIQAAVHGARNSEFTTSNTRELEVLEPIPASFSNVFKSRNALDKELNAMFGYMRKLREADNYASISMAMFDEMRIIYLSRLEQWRTATMVLAAELESKQDRAQLSGILYLQLYHIQVTTLWKTMFVETEMAFDDYTAEFETIIVLASSLMNNPESTSPQVLSLDMGVIPPLFWLCLKCRILKLRKQAIALLKRAPEREGMWHRDSILRYCEWKIETEEEWRGDVPEDEPLPEYARIYAEHLTEGDQSSDVGDEHLVVTFKRGPQGLAIQDTMAVPGGPKMLRHMGNMI